MAQILPGSWELGCVSDGAGNTLDDYAYVFGADGFEIEIRGDGANDAARLITAAPQLFAVVKKYAAEMEQYGFDCHLLAEAQAIIARVEGR